VVEKRKEKKRIANDKGRKTEAERLRESGLPGGGQGRKDRIEKSGVYPVSASEGAGKDAMVHGEASCRQGELGAAGLGGFELIY
jgi:hypothetical protein